MLENIADKYKEENNEELSMEKQDFPQARDILIHFNKNIYPEIEQKYHPEKGIIQETTGNKILQLFRLVKKENIINTPSERSYKELGIQTAVGITDFILGDYPQDISRIKLLLEAIRLDMMSSAYGNIYLDYSYAADRYGEENNETVKRIIKECLKICNDKFWGSVATLTISDNLIILSSGDGGTVIHTK